MNQGKWAKRNEVKRVEVTSSWGSRVAEVRTDGVVDKDGRAHGAFDRGAKPAPVVPIVNPARTKGGVVEGAALSAARQAYVECRQKVADAKVRDAQFAAIAEDSETSEAVVSMWLLQHPEFVQTEHNIKSLENALTEFLSKTRQAISIPILNDVFGHLRDNNFLEKARPVRGEPAARLYPPWEDTESTQPAAQRRINTHVFTAEERQALRNVPLDELAKRVRANYRR